VTLEWCVAGFAFHPVQVRIQAVRIAGDGDSAVPLEAEAAAAGTTLDLRDGVWPDEATLDLGDGVWQVQAFARGYWSQGRQVEVAGQQPAAVSLALWPAASLHGQIVTAGGEPLPSALEVGLSATPPPEGNPAPGPSKAELHCRVDAGTWSCLGPAGVFDVRLEAAGYAPQYRWAVSLKAAENADFGRTELRRAGSVFGRAVRKDGSNPPGPCWARLGPDVDRRGAGDAAGEAVPAGQTSLSAPLNPRGYFQAVGLAPGRYMLAVECAGAAGVRELRVEADSETRIDPPLLLEELTLEVGIAPKADPEGQPWQVTLDQTAPRPRRIESKATASAQGRWTRAGLAAGNYLVTVTSSDGAQWAQRYLDLDSGSGPLSLQLAFVRVAGRVLLGTRPVRAELAFSNNEGGGAATLTSGDDGGFQGLLPVPPGAQETRWTVEAHVAQPPVIQRLPAVSVQPAAGGDKTWLDLKLPTIAVRGTVVSADGQPQSGAQVTFEDANGDRTTTGTDDAGAFKMSDLLPGKYTAMADSPEGVSDRTAFDVVEGSTSDLKLVLTSFRHVPFRVVSSMGPVVGAAVQVWIPPGVPQFFTQTGPDGRFEVKLPVETKEVGLTVGAPGYALKLTRMPISSDNDGSPDANTVTLSASGGRLVLNLQPPGSDPGSPTTPCLVHNGAIELAMPLAGWGTDKAGIGGDGPAVVEAIDPGDYALCLAPDTAALAVLWAGTLPSSSCRKGTLDYGGTLTLSVSGSN
jgi:hypothetical protein